MPHPTNFSTSPSSPVIVVTGPTSGTGLEAARYFYDHGCTVILAARNATKLSHVLATYFPDASSSPGSLHSLILDVSDLSSVRAFVASFKNLGISKLHALVLNAGVNIREFRTSAQGYELNFATNHLGHWLLTGLLLPYLKRGKGRVVSVSSLAHRMVRTMEYEILLGRESSRFERWRIYAESKMANLLFVNELNRRLKHEGVQEILAVASHPGTAKTNILEEDLRGMNWIIRKILETLMSLGLEPKDAAMPIVWATLDEDVEEGCYYGPDGLLEMWGKPKKDCYVAHMAMNQDAMKQLWLVSEEATGFQYQF